jgi:hypothetical protein
MKWLWSFLLIFNMVLFPPGTVLAQTTSSKVHDLYYQSVAYPDSFDFSFELLEASGLLKNEMLSCLIPLREYYFQLARVTIDQCEGAHGGDPQGLWECLRNDPSASLAYWANDMIQVIEDDSIWVNTYTGRNMLMANGLAEQIQPGSWVQIITIGMPIVRQMISCP